MHLRNKFIAHNTNLATERAQYLHELLDCIILIDSKCPIVDSSIKDVFKSTFIGHTPVDLFFIDSLDRIISDQFLTYPFDDTGFDDHDLFVFFDRLLEKKCSHSDCKEFILILTSWLVRDTPLTIYGLPITNNDTISNGNRLTDLYNLFVDQMSSSFLGAFIHCNVDDLDFENNKDHQVAFECAIKDANDGFCYWGAITQCFLGSIRTDLDSPLTQISASSDQINRVIKRKSSTSDSFQSVVDDKQATPHAHPSSSEQSASSVTRSSKSALCSKKEAVSVSPLVAATAVFALAMSAFYFIKRNV